MKQTRTLFIMALLMLYMGAVAQSVTGKVIDEQGKPLSYVTIKLIQPRDSTLISAGLSHEDGTFALSFDSSKHALPLYLEASLLGFSTVGQSITTLSGHTLQLSEESTTLGEVTITAHRLPHKLVPGGLSTIIETSPLAKLDNIYSVLRGVPMVEVKDEEITIIGRGKPIIYINNRLMTNPQQLRILRPHLIKSVEVLTAPGAQYSSSTTAVLKIYTRREPGSGLSGELRQAVSQQLQTRPSSGTWANFLYRTGAWDFVASLNGRVNNYTQRNPIIEMIGKTPDHNWRNRSDFRSYSHHRNLGGTLGLNYEDELRSMGLNYDLWYEPKSGFVNLSNMESELDGHPKQPLYSKTESSSTPKAQHTVAFYYLRHLGQWKSQIDLNYLGSAMTKRYEHMRDGRTTQYEEQAYQTESGKSTQAVGARAELVGPLMGGSFSTGINYSLAQNNYYSNYHQRLSLQDHKSQQREHLLAYYVEYGRPLSATWMLTGGLRMEYIHAHFANMSKRAEDLDYQKLNLFPTLSLGGLLGGWNTQLSMRSYINRPSYWQLNPQYRVISRYELQIGDPNLRPAITYGSQLLFNKSWFTLSFNHLYYTDYLTQSVFLMPDPQDPQKNLPYTIQLKNVNADPYHEVKATLVASPTIGWWRPTAIVMYQQLFGFPLQRFDEQIPYRKPLYYFALNNLFTLPYETTMVLNVSYMPRGGSQANFILDNDVLETRAEVSKMWLRNKSLITSFSVNNLLNRHGMFVRIPNRYTEMNTLLYTPTTFQLRITYRFNSTKSKSRAKSALSTVTERLK